MVENADEGIDAVYSTLVTTTLTGNVEQLYLNSDAAITGIGSATDNEIFGNDNDNTLSGGFGNDTLHGGEGDDVATFLGNASDYTINLAAMTITDVMSAGGDEGTDTLIDIETLRFGDGAELTVSVTDTGEFRVNTYIDQYQYYPSVASYGDSNYAVTWFDNARSDVYGQNYNLLGNPIGGEYRVNTTTYQTQSDPTITSLDDGGYMITWQSNYQDSGSTYGIYGQRYDASGVAVAKEFLINTQT